MLTVERKQQMLDSLKKDYVALTDVVLEVAADAVADMAVLKLEKRAPIEVEEESKEIRLLKREFVFLVEEDHQKALDKVERIYEIAKKYATLRMRDYK